LGLKESVAGMLLDIFFKGEPKFVRPFDTVLEGKN